MKPRKAMYTAHRWLGLIVSLQLLAWSAGGLMFSILDIKAVRGEVDATGWPRLAVDLEAVTLGPAEAVALAREAAGPALDRLGAVEFRNRGLGLFYELLDQDGNPVVKVNASTGEVVKRISPDEAAMIAEEDFRPEARATDTRLIQGRPDGEYRGKRTPAYRVDLDHAKNPHIYVDAITGEVLARRNRKWRIFDFFWMLHIMDYRQRDNFNHLLLTAFSALALATALSGVSLWGWHLVSPKRRHRS